MYKCSCAAHARRAPRLSCSASDIPQMWTCSSLRDAHAKEQTPRTASGMGQPQHGSLPIPLLAVGGRSDGLLGGGQRVGRGPLTEATVWARSGGAPSPADKTLTPISSYVDTFLRLHIAERLPLSSEGRLGSEGSPEPTSHFARPQRHSVGYRLWTQAARGRGSRHRCAHTDEVTSMRAHPAAALAFTYLSCFRPVPQRH